MHFNSKETQLLGSVLPLIHWIPAQVNFFLINFIYLFSQERERACTESEGESAQVGGGTKGGADSPLSEEPTSAIWHLGSTSVAGSSHLPAKFTTPKYKSHRTYMGTQGEHQRE